MIIQRSQVLTRFSYGLCLLVVSVSILLFNSSAFAFCLEPPARVCSDFFKANVVFVGTVLSQRALPDSKDVDEWVYQLQVQKMFKGPTAKTIEVFTENSSARFPLVVGRTYLLFASGIDNRWSINCCGPSGLLSRSKSVLREIERIMHTTGGVIHGRIVKRSSWRGLSGIEVAAQGQNTVYKGISDKDGWFHIRVRPGNYNVTINTPEIVPFDLSQDNPADFIVPQGGCALMQFVAENK